MKIIKYVTVNMIYNICIIIILHRITHSVRQCHSPSRVSVTRNRSCLQASERPTVWFTHGYPFVGSGGGALRLKLRLRLQRVEPRLRKLPGLVLGSGQVLAQGDGRGGVQGLGLGLGWGSGAGPGAPRCCSVLSRGSRSPGPSASPSRIPLGAGSCVVLGRHRT